MGVDSFVMSTSGLLVSFGVAMFCNANMVDEGGVFSPSMGFSGDLDLLDGVSSLALNEGVLALVGLRSGVRLPASIARLRENLSGERSGERFRELSASVKLFLPLP